MSKTKQKDLFDKFYTKYDIADSCIKELLKFVKEATLFIEPSAGNGVFKEALVSNGIEDSLVCCYDIKPDKEWIKQQDFLLLTEEDLQSNDMDLVFIGNPPFGIRNKTTDAFINQCIKLNAETIAFILPSVYDKFARQKIFPQDYSLVSNLELPKNSFLFEGLDYNIPSVFQIWKKTKECKNLRKKEFTSCKDFEILKSKEKHKADFFVFGAAPYNTLDVDEVDKNNRGYYLKSFVDKEKLKSRIKAVDWKKYGKSSANGGVFWLTKSEVYEVYTTHYEENLNE